MTLRLYVAFAAALGGAKLGKWNGLQKWQLRGVKVSRSFNLIYMRTLEEFFKVWGLGFYRNEVDYV